MKKRLMAMLGIIELINAIGWVFTLLVNVKRHKHLEPHHTRSYGILGLRLVSFDNKKVIWFPNKEDIETLGRAE